MERLARLLKQSVDEPTAKASRAVAERTYIELELVGTRVTMLPTPTDAEVAAIEPQFRRFEAAKEVVRVEVGRIRRAPVIRAQLTAVVTPLAVQFDRVQKSMVMSLRSVLMTVRSQVELYKLEHRDAMPDFRTHAWAQLTNATDAAGAFGHGKGRYGPYLAAPPRNPMTGGSGILLVRGKPKSDFRQADPKFGFVIDLTNGLVWALDADGRIFDEDATAAQASIE